MGFLKITTSQVPIYALCFAALDTDSCYITKTIKQAGDQGAVEIRFQKHQIYCGDPIRSGAAKNQLEQTRSSRIRLPRQCKSGSKPSTMEPEDQKENRQTRSAGDSHV